MDEMPSGVLSVILAVYTWQLSPLRVRSCATWLRPFPHLGSSKGAPPERFVFWHFEFV